MIDIKLLEKDQAYLARYRRCVENRKMDPVLVDQVLELQQEWKRLTTKAEHNKAEQNKITEAIAQKKRAKEDASTEQQQVQELKERHKSLGEVLDLAKEKVDSALHALPNLCNESVPVGKSEADNKVIRTIGAPRELAFAAREHWELGEKLKGIDFERAGKVAGARFAFLRGEIARLELAIINLMMDVQIDGHGYEAIFPPYMANSQSFFGVGQFPKFKNDVFHLEGTDYYLIPTAEVPVTNLFAGEILAEKDLPQRFAGFSPCFRSEAGSYGKDTKGLIRQHQFHKVELMIFSHPDQSHQEHENITNHAEKILQILELPYRVSLLCTGDISFSAAKCHDLEVWLPGQKGYREISSCSNFEDFQARRADIRFKPKDGGKPQFVHTLNGSGLAVGRTLIAVLENYQNEEGGVEIPEALRKYMGGRKAISVKK